MTFSLYDATLFTESGTAEKPYVPYVKEFMCLTSSRLLISGVNAMHIVLNSQGSLRWHTSV